MKSLLRWMTVVPAVTAMLLMVGGCAAKLPAQHVRFADATKSGAQIDWTRPMVLEFQAGDRLPLRVAFDDQIFGLSPAAPPIELVAKRHGFVRIEGARITGSLTGDDFDTSPLEPGKFRFGLSITREGSWLELVVATPRHAEPAPSKQP